MRNVLIASVCALFLCSCASMTSQQKQAVAGDVLTGLQIVAAGVAAMPGADPMTVYWSKYASGVLAKVAPANPTSASPSPAAQ